MSVLAARGVSRRYGGRVALEPCDFALEEGEAVALVGPNGAGKTTLLSILAGALDPTQGQVERPVRTGWAPQRPALYGKLTPQENVELFARLQNVPPLPTDLPDQPTIELSVGQRQRLNLTIAFLGEPRVLLLDEPTAALDAERREELWARVADLCAQGGAVCFVTQNLDEVGHADRIGHIDEGRLTLP